jgi:hypothetical protein
VATGGFSLSAVAGAPSTTQTVATLTDPGGVSSSSSYLANIAWGDGTVSQGSIAAASGPSAPGFTVSASHNYAQAGNFTIGVTIDHEGIVTPAVSSTASVANPVPAAITSINNATFKIGSLTSFTVMATGSPAPTLSESGNLPDGVKFTAATGVLSGTPSPGTAATYNIIFTAHNGIGSDFNQPFTLTVPGKLPPAPLAKNDTFVLSQSVASAATATNGVLVNDVSNDNQPSLLHASPFVTTTHGTLVLNADGSFSYTPGADFQGLDRFTYQLSEHDVADNTDVPGNTATVTLLSYQASIVDKLYHQVLGRSPDDGGLQYWTSKIMAGASYSVVAEGIFESDERLDAIIGGGQLGSITYQGYYPQFLFRPVEPDGLAYWKSVWKRDGGPDNVIAGMIGSPEFRFGRQAAPRPFGERGLGHGALRTAVEP